MPLISQELIQTTLDITDYSTIIQNVKRNLLVMLKQYFEQRCYMSSYIKSVDSVERYSDFKVYKRDPTLCSVHVVFKATRYRLPKNSLEVFQVISVKGSKISAKSDYCLFTFQHDNSNKALQVGKKVPVVIDGSIYTPFKYNITSTGRLYVPTPPKAFSFKFLSPNLLDALKVSVEELKKSKSDNDNYEKFVKHIFGDIKNAGEKIPPNKLDKSHNGYYMVSNSPNEIAFFKISKEDVKKQQAKTLSQFTIEMEAELELHIERIRAIKTLCEAYPKEVDYNENSLVWKTIEELKKRQ